MSRGLKFLLDILPFLTVPHRMIATTIVAFAFELPSSAFLILLLIALASLALTLLLLTLGHQTIHPDVFPCTSATLSCLFCFLNFLDPLLPLALAPHLLCKLPTAGPSPLPASGRPRHGLPHVLANGVPTQTRMHETHPH